MGGIPVPAGGGGVVGTVAAEVVVEVVPEG